MYNILYSKLLMRTLLPLILLVLSFNSWGLSNNQVRISQKTGPYFILDHNKPATGPRAGFVAIEIINVSNQPISNFKITLNTISGTGFSVGIGEDSSRSFLTIQPGEKAELTLFNPLQIWQVNKANLQTLSYNTPWFGQEVTGRVVQVWCNTKL
jgi:hypothetical protein